MSLLRPGSAHPGSALFRAAIFVDRFHFVFLFIAAPFLLFPSPARALVMLLVPLPWIAAWIVRGRPFTRTPLDVALLVLGVTVLVSLYATYSIAFSLPKLAGVLLGFASYYAIVRWLDGPQRLWLAMQLFILAGAALGVIALLGTEWPAKFPVIGQVVSYLPRVIRGLPGAEDGFQANSVGGALVFFVPLQIMSLAACWSGEQAARLPAWLNRWQYCLAQSLLLAFTGAILLLTQSRGAWFGLLLGLMALLAWHSRRTRRWLGFMLVAAAAVLLVAGARNLWELVTEHTGPALDIQFGGRAELWATALHAIQEFPLTGVGLNAFRTVMPVLYPAYLNPPDFDVAHAHNQLLMAALDLGLPGLVAYLALLLGAARMLSAAGRRGPDPWLRAMSAGLGAGLLANFVFGLTDAITLGSKLGIVLWFVLALATGVFWAAGARTPPRPLEVTNA
jgi:putative inorganic carbon (HCO3(-)) transporter